MRKRNVILAALSMLFFVSNAQIQEIDLLNAPVDVSPAFRDFSNTYYVADNISDFDPETGKGTITYKRYEYSTRMAFNNILAVLRPVPANEFPTTEYEESPQLPLTIQFISPKTIRINAKSNKYVNVSEESLMLVNGKVTTDKKGWTYKKIKGGHSYTSTYGKLVIRTSPISIEFYDKNGKFLTKTINHDDHKDSTYTPVMPFSYVRRASDYSRSYCASLRLSPDEKIFGCGESYAGFNKRGQRVVLSTDDGNGIQNETMYKPIPFFMSSRGYGVFMHTSSPITCDFGKYFSAVNSLMIGDEELDLFLFLGSPKEILDEYTDLTGKSPMPPLWSFGFWMSRITYLSQEDGYRIAKLLRDNKIPSDVIHFDTGLKIPRK